jgi:hypothetical protein
MMTRWLPYTRLFDLMSNILLGIRTALRMHYLAGHRPQIQSPIPKAMLTTSLSQKPDLTARIWLHEDNHEDIDLILDKYLESLQ